MKLRLKFVKLSLNAAVDCQNTGQCPGFSGTKNPQSLQFQLTAARARVLSSPRAVGQGVRAPYPAAGTMRTVPLRRWHLPLKRPEIRAQQLEPWVSVGVPAGFASSAAAARWARGHFASCSEMNTCCLGGHLCQEITVTRTFAAICYC